MRMKLLRKRLLVHACLSATRQVDDATVGLATSTLLTAEVQLILRELIPLLPDEASSVASCASDGNGTDERDVEGNKYIEIIIYASHFSIGAEAAANENAAFGCNTAAAHDDAASDASDALDI
eukprot:CAMPEP_0202497780 /NCGR_PEP_ID=MMETSP1361-20130828/23819_1 /ASSEMBLY_ACC=CAM_ASM_000849 /TAXON_ID=210615 /ORGANISM="Staurosira complex sp., Strain CCMP2646" /LENGTH=122 /DNA_ID=CAMNT_0049129471 /DNA_START=644 /DNA_END=1013 /DNA_ORIENTATION=-